MIPAEKIKLMPNASIEPNTACVMIVLILNAERNLPAVTILITMYIMQRAMKKTDNPVILRFILGVSLVEGFAVVKVFSSLA